MRGIDKPRSGGTGGAGLPQTVIFLSLFIMAIAMGGLSRALAQATPTITFRQEEHNGWTCDIDQPGQNVRPLVEGALLFECTITVTGNTVGSPIAWYDGDYSPPALGINIDSTTYSGNVTYTRFMFNESASAANSGIWRGIKWLTTRYDLPINFAYQQHTITLPGTGVFLSTSAEQVKSWIYAKGGSAYTAEFRVVAYYGAYTATPTPAPTLTPTQFTCPNGSGMIYDNGFESYPESEYWDPYSDTEQYEFGRVSSRNIVDRIRWGTAYCGDGMQHVGVWSRTITNSYRLSSDVKQEFCWEGGDLYWSLSAKREDLAWGGSVPRFDALVLFYNDDTSIHYEFDQYVFAGTWTHIGYSIPDLPPGYYTVHLSSSIPDDVNESELLSTYGPYLLYDNLQIDTEPVEPGTCIQNNLPITTTTPTATALFSPTPTCPPYAMGGSCGFTGHSTDGWTSLDGYSGPYNHPILGEVYFVAYRPEQRPGAVYYPGTFYKCGDGKMYLNFWAWGVFMISIRDTRTGQIVTQVTNGSTLQYQLLHYAYMVDIPAGDYEILISALNRDGVYLDSFVVGAGQQVACSNPPVTYTPGPSPTYTPTPPRTNTPTGTITAAPPTFTPRPTATATATRTAYPSLTPWPTYTQPPPTATVTPGPTRTRTPTATMPPTHTQPPTDTVDVGTDTPTPRPTYTPPPTQTLPPEGPTDTPTPTYSAPSPPQQPPPACYAPCVRPSPPTFSLYLGDNVFEQVINLVRLDTLWYLIKYAAGYSISYLGGWVDYGRCTALSYIVWCPEHTDQIAAIPNDFASKEPFGTINEVKDSYYAVATVYSLYNWAETGVKVNGTPIASDGSPNWDLFQPDPRSPYLGGEIDITGQHPYITGASTTTCDFELEPWVGNGLAQGMCFAWTTLDRLGVLGWFQFIVNICAIIFLIYYIMRRWVNAGTGSG